MTDQADQFTRTVMPSNDWLGFAMSAEHDAKLNRMKFLQRAHLRPGLLDQAELWDWALPYKLSVIVRFFNSRYTTELQCYTQNPYLLLYGVNVPAYLFGLPYPFAYRFIQAHDTSFAKQAIEQFQRSPSYVS